MAWTTTYARLHGCSCISLLYSLPNLLEQQSSVGPTPVFVSHTCHQVRAVLKREKRGGGL